MINDNFFQSFFPVSTGMITRVSLIVLMYVISFFGSHMSNFFKSPECNHGVWHCNEVSNLILKYLTEEYCMCVHSLRIFTYTHFLFFIVSLLVLVARQHQLSRMGLDVLFPFLPFPLLQSFRSTNVSSLLKGWWSPVMDLPHCGLFFVGKMFSSSFNLSDWNHTDVS